MMRRLALMLIVGSALGASDAPAEFLQMGTVTRTYSGSASVRDYNVSSPGPIISNPLSASESGLGSLGVVEALSIGYSQSTVARGTAASALLTQPGGSSSTLSLSTGTYASFFNTGILVNASSSGLATASSSFVGTIDLTGTATSTDLLFSPTYASSGTNNTGTLTITSSLQGQLLQANVSTLSSPFQLAIQAGSLVTVSVTIQSQSFRGPGTFSLTLYNDTDSQSFQLGVSAQAVPEPSTFASLGVGLALALGVRARRGRSARRPGRVSVA